ncbi:hypothetical protein ACE41H_07735 [Paenibacillus enshidis]|uniref:Glycosyltransferase n=1 Tax=Paenibacillus enshidis TaxID=1458439 RepID=A0ABV5AS16_9BACL
MKSLLIISSDVIASKMAGPGIRYWNLALELSKHFNVILAIPNYHNFDLHSELNGTTIKLSSTNCEELKKHAKSVDSILLQGDILWKFRFLRSAKASIIVDLYDPFVLEHLELNQNDMKGNLIFNNIVNIQNDQLKYGDYFICASEKQKDFWLGTLNALKRINLKEYSISKSLEHLIGVVPFGIPNAPPDKTKEVLKGVYPGIDKHDRVIVWGGGIWEWFDPITLIEAMKLVSYQRSDIKLFFMGIKHPNASIKRMRIVDETIELSNQLGLTDKFVFFNDWVPYEERQNYLLEADIGVNIHKNHIETRYSFRTRMLDYIWTRLPILTNSGDFFSDEIKDKSIGMVIENLTPENLAKQIMEFPGKSFYESNFKSLINQYQWSNNIKCIVNYVQNNKPKHRKKNIDFSLMKKAVYVFCRGINLIYCKLKKF